MIRNTWEETCWYISSGSQGECVSNMPMENRDKENNLRQTPPCFDRNLSYLLLQAQRQAVRVSRATGQDELYRCTSAEVICKHRSLSRNVFLINQHTLLQTTSVRLESMIHCDANKPCDSGWSSFSIHYQQLVCNDCKKQ